MRGGRAYITQKPRGRLAKACRPQQKAPEKFPEFSSFSIPYTETPQRHPVPRSAAHSFGRAAALSPGRSVPPAARSRGRPPAPRRRPLSPLERPASVSPLPAPAQRGPPAARPGPDPRRRVARPASGLTASTACCRMEVNLENILSRDCSSRCREDRESSSIRRRRSRVRAACGVPAAGIGRTGGRPPALPLARRRTPWR